MADEQKSNVTSLFEDDSGLSHKDRETAQSAYDAAQIEPSIRGAITKTQENLARLEGRVVGVAIAIVTDDMKDAISAYSSGVYRSDQGLALTLGHLNMFQQLLIDEATADRMHKTTEDD